MQQKVNMTWVGLSSTERRGLTDNEEAQQVRRLDWGEPSVKRPRLARRPAGQCEKDTAEQSQAQPSPKLHWDRGGPGATGRGMH